MAHVILMPKAGQSMTEGTIVTWLKQEGDTVEQGVPLLEIETDKANLELEAEHNGVLRKVFVPEGEVCAVLTPIGVIGQPDEAIDFDALRRESMPVAEANEDKPSPPAQRARSGAVESTGTPAGAVASSPAPAAVSRAAAPAPPRRRETVERRAPDPAPRPSATGIAPRVPSPPRSGGRRVLASPLARRLASERGVDLGSVRGSGPGGRILKRDVESAAPAANGGGAIALFGPTTDYPPPSPRPPAQVLFEGMRGAIATALQHSKRTIPHFYATAAVDVTSALELKAERARQGVRVTVNDLVLRACVLALLDEPRVNCRVFDDHIEYPEDVHLGLAVGHEEGLVVPVVLRAQNHDLAGLAAESRRVVELAQQGKLVGSGQGTFTVSNLGMFGVESFAAIINPPEGAILAVGALGEELIAVAGGFFPRRILRLTLSSDHRAVDGLLAARFLARARYWLEARLGE